MMRNMARHDAYLDHLGKVKLFSSCTRKELQTIAKASDELAVKAGTLLVDQGQAGTQTFVILEGTATVKRNGRKIATLGPGAPVGELSLLDHGPRTASVTADSDMKVLVLAQRQFSALIAEVPSIASKMLAILAGRVRELDRANFG
jgi:CRP/FNR family cyclic AMP-dependent transcriptional regulator